MIKVTYRRSKNRVTVDGHAHSGEVGHDLVCAAVSTLAYTLALFVGNMKSAGQVRYPTVELEEGHALIDANVPKRYRASVTLVFDSICAGFELLSQSYPKNVTYEIMDDE